MVKKTKIELETIPEIEQRVGELKLELAKYKGMLASKTKTNNTAKKSLIKKDIARLLTKKNQLVKQELKNKVKNKLEGKK